jgi:hypothetical protein
MSTLEALALITIYYICMLFLCYLYTNSRFYKEERVFINYDLDNLNDTNYINTKKMA